LALRRHDFADAVHCENVLSHGCLRLIVVSGCENG
jgi:hypothetical protein